VLRVELLPFTEQEVLLLTLAEPLPPAPTTTPRDDPGVKPVRDPERNPPPPPPAPTHEPPPPPPPTTRYSMLVTLCGTVHEVDPVLVNFSTTYFVPVVVPEIVLLFPVNPDLPVELIVKLCVTFMAAL
jgi:hypothetical protein